MLTKRETSFATSRNVAIDSSKSLIDFWVVDSVLQPWVFPAPKTAFGTQSNTVNKDLRLENRASPTHPSCLTNCNRMQFFHTLLALSYTTSAITRQRTFSLTLQDTNLRQWESTVQLSAWWAGICRKPVILQERGAEVDLSFQCHAFPRQSHQLIQPWQLRETIESSCRRLWKTFLPMFRRRFTRCQSLLCVLSDKFLILNRLQPSKLWPTWSTTESRPSSNLSANSCRRRWWWKNRLSLTSGCTRFPMRSKI